MVNSGAMEEGIVKTGMRGSGRYQFGEYELDVRTGELRRRGRRLKLRGRPLELLAVLVEEAGEVVTREELIARLWPDGVHVDFEHGLGNAILKLRETLGDSAEKPRYVETLPRRGYRFVAAVERVERNVEAVAGKGIEKVAGNEAEVVRRSVWGRVREKWMMAMPVGVAAALLWFLPVTAPQKQAVESPAREDYLRGVHFWEQKTPEGTEKSRGYFESAALKDPGFAPAHAGLAKASHFLGAMGRISREEAYERASGAARRALELDANCVEALVILAETTFRFSGKDEGVEALFRKAIAIDPRSADARHWFGNYLFIRGRRGEGVEELRRARELAPLDLHISVDLADSLYEVGRVEEAKELLGKTLELDGNYPKTHLLLGHFAMKEGRHEEAVRELRRVVELAPEVPKFLAQLCEAHLEAGQVNEAAAVLAELKGLGERRSVPEEMVRPLEKRLDAMRLVTRGGE